MATTITTHHYWILTPEGEAKVRGLPRALVRRPVEGAQIVHDASSRTVARAVQTPGGWWRWELDLPVTLRWWDAETEAYVEHRGAELVESTAGGGSVEYRQTWLLVDGRSLSLTRHKDRGDLGTDVRVR